MKNKQHYIVTPLPWVSILVCHQLCGLRQIYLTALSLMFFKPRIRIFELNAFLMSLYVPNFYDAKKVTPIQYSVGSDDIYQSLNHVGARLVKMWKSCLNSFREIHLLRLFFILLWHMFRKCTQLKGFCFFNSTLLTSKCNEPEY